MAVQISREGWLQLFSQYSGVGGFLSSFFTLKPGGIFQGNKVALDVERYGEDVAVVIEKCTGSNLNDITQFTTKEFTPPSYGEAFPVEACELLDRDAGVDPFSAAYQGYQTAFIKRIMKGFRVIDDKIKRAFELQASQILQTGKLVLKNADGTEVYTLDFKPKLAHFPTVSTPWSAAGATPLKDLESLARVIRTNGKINPNIAIMGAGALSNFLANESVEKALDARRMELGEIDPKMEDSGATVYGVVKVGVYELQIWAYPDTYKDPATGNTVDYVEPGNVIVMSSRARLDRAFAKVPLLVEPDPRIANLIPPRLSSTESNFDVTPNAYVAQDGSAFFGDLKSRGLCIPVQIDGFGCLKTKAA